MSNHTTKKPFVAASVAVIVLTDGNKGRTKDIPIHELPLMRRRWQMDGHQVTVDAEWPETIQRVRFLDADDFNRERNRIRETYGAFPHGERIVDLVTEVYGPGGTGLATAMKRVYEAYRAQRESEGDEPSLRDLEQLERLCGAPETTVEQFIEPITPGTDPGAELNGELVDELKAAGIGSGKAREVAAMAAHGVPTLADLEKLFKGNEAKAAAALHACEKFLSAKV